MPSAPPTLISRIVFWFLGIALYLTLSILPNYLLTKFYTGGQVHTIVMLLVAVILGLIYGSVFLKSRGSAPESAG
jgi:hypothetical protein